MSGNKGEKRTLRVFIRRSKTDQHGRGRFSYCSMDTTLTKWFSRYAFICSRFGIAVDNLKSGYIIRKDPRSAEGIFPYKSYLDVTREALQAATGSTAARATTHSFRRGGAVALRDLGTPDSVIAQMGGWASLGSMQIYLQTGGAKALTDAAQRLTVSGQAAQSAAPPTTTTTITTAKSILTSTTAATAAVARSGQQ